MENKILDTLTERIAWAIEIIKSDEHLAKSITDVDLAKLLGTNKDTLATYRNQKGLLKGEVIENIVRRYNFNPSWLFKGEGEPFPGARKKYPEVCGERVSVFYNLRGSDDNDPSENFVFIKQVNGKISAGGGLEPDDSVDMRLAFRRDWFAKKGNPDNMSLIKVVGDSMYPTLLPGDLVLVDHSHKSISSQGGIYAISIDHEIMIKRVQLLFQEGKILVISDNKKYPAQEIDADKITINGKVIWYARDIER